MSEPVAAWCPVCGARLAGAAFVQEYWTADTRNFVCWCATCHELTTVTFAPRLVATEPAHTADLPGWRNDHGSPATRPGMMRS